MRTHLPDYPQICVPIRSRCNHEITSTNYMKMHCNGGDSTAVYAHVNLQTEVVSFQS